MRNISFILIVLLVGFSCQNTSKKETLPESNQPAKANPKAEEIEEKVNKINASETELTVANSLSYQHNDGSQEEVFAFLDKDQKIVKLEENFKEGKSGNNGTRFFYFENGKRIMSQERFMDAENGKGKYRERISCYKPDGKSFYSKERVADFEEDLEKETFKQIPNYDCDMSTAENVLNQEGVFATTFQGFATDGPVDYLIVGGPGESGFASAIAVQYVDNTISILKKNEVDYIGTPLSIQFEKMMDERKLEFQILTGMKILSK